MKAKQLLFPGQSLHDNSERRLQPAETLAVHSLAGHLNTALTVSDLSGSAMPTPRSINCSAWYNFASSVWDSSAWAKVRGHAMAETRAKESQSCTLNLLRLACKHARSGGQYVTKSQLKWKNFLTVLKTKTFHLAAIRDKQQVCSALLVLYMKKNNNK